jgi:beta-lactamase superfamily II metal-dependent hydrolase
MLNSKTTVFSVIFLVLVLLVGCTSTKTANEINQDESPQNTKQVAEATAINDKKQNVLIPNNTQVSEPAKVEQNGELQVHYIDVGQGASQLIVGSTGKTILIDAGNNDKASVVMEYLKRQKISRIDILIGTHPDADHVGGLDKIIDNFDIGKIYMPKVQANTKTFEDVLLAIQRKGLRILTAKSGVTFEWEPDSVVKMIAPVGEHSDANDMSSVVHLIYGSTRFLFTGDAEGKSEQEMIESKVALKSDVLLVGHHGSKSSTSQGFLDAVKPSYAVIQSGKGSNYGHPNAEVLKRLSNSGVKIYRNDEQGNIIFTTNGNEIVVKYDNGTNIPIKGDLAPTSTSNPPMIKPNEAKQEEAIVVYKSCTEVKVAGKAPLHRGEPGYSSKMDRDNDGVACE